MKTTIGEQLTYPEGYPDDFNPGNPPKRAIYPHTSVVFRELGKQVTYTGPGCQMTRPDFLKTARNAAIGKFDSADWSVSPMTV